MLGRLAVYTASSVLSGEILEVHAELSLMIQNLEVVGSLRGEDGVLDLRFLGALAIFAHF